MTQRRFTILVADDDADSGQDALHKFQVDPCDMVMLDVDMPGLGGRRLHRQAGQLGLDRPPGALPVSQPQAMLDLRVAEARATP